MYKKILSIFIFLLFAFYLFPFSVFGQLNSNFRTKSILVTNYTLQIDTLSIIPNTFFIFNENKEFLPQNAYTINYFTAQLILDSTYVEKNINKRLLMNYRVFTTNLTQKYSHKEISIISQSLSNINKRYSHSNSTKESFFDENCAYHLLSLLEVARPTLHLRDKLPPWVIPADTVRAVIAVPGILKKAIFRPASTTHLHHRLHQFSPKQQDLVYKLATREIEHTDLSALDLTTRTKVLEVAYDYLYYQYKGKQANKMGAQHLRKLLIASNSS